MDALQGRQAAFGRNDGEVEGLLLALWQPDRPQNFGAMLRLASCLDLAVDVIEPAGFPLDDRRIRTAALDYGPVARWRRFTGPEPFLHLRRGAGRRLLLLSTHGDAAYHEVGYRADDVLVLGSESRGVPPGVHELADLRVRVPMAAGRRSLNVVAAATLVAGEALRQTGGLDRLHRSGR